MDVTMAHAGGSHRPSSLGARGPRGHGQRAAPAPRRGGRGAAPARAPPPAAGEHARRGSSSAPLHAARRGVGADSVTARRASGGLASLAGRGPPPRPPPLLGAAPPLSSSRPPLSARRPGTWSSPAAPPPGDPWRAGEPYYSLGGARRGGGGSARRAVLSPLGSAGGLGAAGSCGGMRAGWLAAADVEHSARPQPSLGIADETPCGTIAQLLQSPAAGFFLSKRLCKLRSESFTEPTAGSLNSGVWWERAW